MAVKLRKGADLNNNRGINFADPTSATDAATKQYVDNLVAGLANKRTVRVKSTANMAVASAVINGASVDGKTLVTGDRIFLGSQTSTQENGIYIVAASGAASRATDMDAGSEIPGAFIIVSEGTLYGDTMWLETTDGPITVGTTPLAFTQIQMGVTYTADNNGITLSSTVFSLVLDGSSLSKGASGLRIGTAAGGAGLVVNAGTGVIDVVAGTGMVVNANDIAIDTSVVVRKFAADCVVTTNPQTFTHGLGTNDVTVEVWLVASNEKVFPDVTKGSGTVIVDWGSVPAAGEYRVVVHG